VVLGHAAIGAVERRRRLLTVMAASSVAFIVSGNFTPRSRRKSFPVQLSRVTHMHPVTLSLSPQSRGNAGVN